MKQYLDLTTHKLNPHYRFYEPKLNKVKLIAGAGLILACICTPMTNWMIPVICVVCISQRPINWDKIRENVNLTRLKLKITGLFG